MHNLFVVLFLVLLGTLEDESAIFGFGQLGNENLCELGSRPWPKQSLKNNGHGCPCSTDAVCSRDTRNLVKSLARYGCQKSLRVCKPLR